MQPVYDSLTDCSWRSGMAKAYTQGLADGKAHVYRPELSGGFSACYNQGYGHGSGECCCQMSDFALKHLLPKRCSCCGQWRHA